VSGHSKWAQIKHKKAKEDVRRGKIFSKLARGISIAAREGGGDPEKNAALAAAIEKAKSYNMPADTIERAIKRGTGELEGTQLERIVYEGFGPNGVAFLVDVMTDNRNRSAADMRHIFSKYGGNLGSAGSVSWMFTKKGHILIDRDGGPEEDELLVMAIEAGAEDIKAADDQWEIVTEPTALAGVAKSLEEMGIKIAVAELTMEPKTIIKLDKDEARKVLKLVDALEDHDDVQEVYTNFDISSDILEEIASEA
jgi:YebC/PmpR family DNA-binding regulatory protein